MSRKKLKEMLKREMDDRINSYSTSKQRPDKLTLKFDLKTDLLGKKPEEEIKEEVKEEIKEEIKEEVKEVINQDETSESESTDTESSETSESEDEDYYTYYKNKINKNEERKSESIEKRKRDDTPGPNKIDKEDRRRDDRDDRRRDDRDDRRRDDRDDRRRDDRDDRRRDDRDDRRRDDRDDRRRDDRDDRRRNDKEDRKRDDRDDRRRDDRDNRRRDDRDDRRIDDKEDRRRDDRDDRRREVDIKRDESPLRNRGVTKGNLFLDIPKKYILQFIKSQEVDNICSDCVDEVKDILYHFTSYMFEQFSDPEREITAERDDVKTYMSFYLEDEDKELPQELIIPSKDMEKGILSVCDKYNVKIKKDVVYLVHMFIECILLKIITGSKMINDIGKAKRLSGKEIKAAYNIYML